MTSPRDTITLLKPEENPEFYGHDRAEEILGEAIADGQMHHAWLIAGPRGIGKATLAFRAARRLLKEGGSLSSPGGGNERILSFDPDDQVFRLIATGAHPDLRVIRKAVNENTGAERGEIIVDAIRALSGFFATTAGRDGWRIAIIDSVDDLNRNAANALLKQLEEPPNRAVFFLISHAPGRLLPTIRSRCRLLRLRPLEDDVLTKRLEENYPELDAREVRELVTLAQGSLGLAHELAASNGAAIYDRVRALFASLPDLDMTAVHRLAASLSGKRNASDFATFTRVFKMLLESSIYAASGVIGEGRKPAPWAHNARLDHWLALWDKAAHLFDRAGAVNLDPMHVTLVMFDDLQAACSGAA